MSVDQRLADTLRHAWLGRGALACALWPLSLLYRLLWHVRQALYRWGVRPVYRAPVPVVVVGNVIAGGAGKTPVTIALVRHLQARGWHPGVVSRGHGRATQDCRAVMPDSTAQEVGDEPLLIARVTGAPVMVAARRGQAAQALLRQQPQVDVLLCDDGLQHLALARDLEVVVFDDRGPGNGWLLPAGPLREPWPRARAKARQLVLVNGRPGTAPRGVDGPCVERALGPLAHDRSGQTLALSALRQQPLGALAGIARPEVFFDMLERQGLAPHPTLALPDHADFASSWPALRQRLRAAPVWLCTEKDAVKLFPLLADDDPRLLAVPLELRPGPAFLAALDEALSSVAPRTPSPHGHETA